MKVEAWQSYLGIGVGVAALAGISLYLISSLGEEEEIKDIEAPEDIYTQLEKELSSVTKPKKGEHTDPSETNSIVYSKEFTLKVYYLLSKYATKIKKSYSDSSFNRKIRFIKDEDEDAYRKEFYKNEKDEADALKDVTNALLKQLKLMEQDYIISLNYHSEKPGFKEEMMKIHTELSKEISTDIESNEVPEDLTKERATEIRDFARDTTNTIIMDLSQKIKGKLGLQNMQVSLKLSIYRPISTSRPHFV